MPFLRGISESSIHLGACHGCHGQGELWFCLLELEDPYIYGPLERMAFNLNDCSNSNFTFSQSTLDDILAPAAMGGLSTPKSVGYYLRFLASSRRKRQFLAAGTLRKDNPRVQESSNYTAVAPTQRERAKE